MTGGRVSGQQSSQNNSPIKKEGTKRYVHAGRATWRPQQPPPTAVGRENRVQRNDAQWQRPVQAKGGRTAAQEGNARKGGGEKKGRRGAPLRSTPVRSCAHMAHCARSHARRNRRRPDRRRVSAQLPASYLSVTRCRRHPRASSAKCHQQGVTRRASPVRRVLLALQRALCHRATVLVPQLGSLVVPPICECRLHCNHDAQQPVVGVE